MTDLFLYKFWSFMLTWSVRIADAPFLPSVKPRYSSERQLWVVPEQDYESNEFDPHRHHLPSVDHLSPFLKYQHSFLGSPYPHSFPPHINTFTNWHQKLLILETIVPKNSLPTFYNDAMVKNGNFVDGYLWVNTFECEECCWGSCIQQSKRE